MNLKFECEFQLVLVLSTESFGRLYAAGLLALVESIVSTHNKDSKTCAIQSTSKLSLKKFVLLKMPIGPATYASDCITEAWIQNAPSKLFRI